MAGQAARIEWWRRSRAEGVSIVEAATWSAIAATFAAISSLLIMLIQRRNLLKSVRPELVLLDWDRGPRGEGEGRHDVLTFKTIRNVGKGVALNVILNASQDVDNRPVFCLSTTRLPILAVNESRDLNAEMSIWWKNVKSHALGAKFLHISISIMHWDSRGMRHETKYTLFAREDAGGYCGNDSVAPGVMMGFRSTQTRPVWWLKLCSWIRYRWWGAKKKANSTSKIKTEKGIGRRG
jgi:hypothetical protein